MRNIAKILLVSILGGVITLGAYKIFFDDPSVQTVIESQPTPFRPASLNSAPPEGFSYAAEKTVNAVVHVTTAVKTEDYPRSPLEYFFGTPDYQRQPRIQMGSGSGVIISDDGYIVTNNHVIQNAQNIKISLNSGLEYDAEVIGSDPTTDIALVKIAEKQLPYLAFSNSDQVKVGEWVLAVGNPFNLTSTVTAGIISAKSRSIGVIRNRAAIESFIQTDAAVNPGNSGGALVNTNGDLIGINSAISTHTGSYEGYSFAIPSNIVKKVVEDLREFGTVQRAFIGVNISDISQRMADELDLDITNGVYVGGVSEGGAAQEAGIQTGDVIIAIDDRQVNKSSELQELIGRKRPGDRVSVTVNREGQEKSFKLQLRNMQGTTTVVKPEEITFASQLGADLEPISSATKRRLGITYGVEVDGLTDGLLKKNGVPEGFIITKINRMEIRSMEDVDEAVSGLEPKDPVVIQGYGPDGRARYYAFGY